MEAWADIPEFPDYQVSNHGRFRNVHTDELVAVSFTTEGAPKVGLYSDAHQQTRAVKHLVATAFVEGYTPNFNTPICKNGDQTNCHWANLAWRPRSFAWKYATQFNDERLIIEKGGVVDIRDCATGVDYPSVMTAAVMNGLLIEEVHASVVSLAQKRCFPTNQRFGWQI